MANEQQFYERLERLVDKLEECLAPYRSEYTKKMVDLPCFDGIDPSNWILRAEEYFNRFDIYDAQRVRLVAFDMTGEGAEWYTSMKSNRLLSSWADFKEKVMIRFGNPYAPEKLPISTINSESKEPAVDQCFELEMDSSSQSEVVEEEFLPLSYALEEKEQVEQEVEQEEKVLEPQVEQFDENLKQVSYVEVKATTATYNFEQKIEVIQSLDVEEVVLEDILEFPKIQFVKVEVQDVGVLEHGIYMIDDTHNFTWSKRNEGDGSLQTLAQSALSKRRMVLKLYAFKEVFKEWLHELYLLHLEDKVFLRGWE